MSTPKLPENNPQVAALTLKELAAVLVRHFDLHEGEFKWVIEFQIGAVGADQGAPTPAP